MQFIGSTWRRGLGQRELEPRSSPPAADGQGYATDGDGDGDADPWSWADATHSAARYLASMNATADPEAAVYGYNHSSVLRRRRARHRRQLPGRRDGRAGVVRGLGRQRAAGHRRGHHRARRHRRATSACWCARPGPTGSCWAAAATATRSARSSCGGPTAGPATTRSTRCPRRSARRRRPGRATSNHEQGLAIDFTCNGGSIGSHSNPCFRWLEANAAAFGLRNLPSEPWHWSSTAPETGCPRVHAGRRRRCDVRLTS